MTSKMKVLVMAAMFGVGSVAMAQNMTGADHDAVPEFDANAPYSVGTHGTTNSYNPDLPTD